MKKALLYGIVLLLIIVGVATVLFRGRLTDNSTVSDQTEDEIVSDNNGDENLSPEKETNLEQTAEGKEVLSPFDYLPIEEKVLHRAVMTSIENTPQARPQSGICEAPIVYEFLVEGGITRFLALYWSEIPDKIGPIRSVRPYMVKIADEYDALLLHAGASPEGFELLEKLDFTNLDQIYNGKYYWRSQDKPTPHNLYTGVYRISEYLEDMMGVEYSNRFNFEEVIIITSAKKKADIINIGYWGNYEVIYEYNPRENHYKRYIDNIDNPHNCANGDQITVKNIIVQFTETSIKDDVGRLNIELEGSNKALYFGNGYVSKGHWEKDDQGLTKFYDENNNLITINPGNTWIQIVPNGTNITYKESD